MAKLTAQLRNAIWHALHDLTRHHRAFEDAPWALKKPDLKALEELARAYRPEDPAEGYQYLFDDQMPDIGEKRSDRITEYTKAVRQARRRAVLKVYNRSGLPGVQRLAGVVKLPFPLGWSLGDADLTVDEDSVLADIDGADAHRADFAAGFAWQRVESQGLDWVDDTLRKLSTRPLAQARVLRAVRDGLSEAWRRIEQQGANVEAAYWKEFVPMGLGTEFPLVNTAAKYLVKHNRAGSAVDLLALYADNVAHPVAPDVAANALEVLVDSKSEEQQRVSPYELQRLLELLRISAIDQDRVALLEWRLLPGLGYGVPTPNLESRLARDPGFFVELVSMCFKRADGSRDRDVSPQVAQTAYRVLHDWKIVPGSVERNGAVNEAELKGWIERALELLDGVDRREIGQIYIGHVLAHAREDDDGLWPTLPVRNVIESLSSETIERGFGTEIHNKRGVTSRGLTAGGVQEYDLAVKFARWAAAEANEWPRTSAVLRRVADDYRAQARVEDEEADRIRKGLDLHG